MILAVDAERMLGRAAEVGQGIPVTISPDAEDTTDRNEAFLIDLVGADLAARTTQVEPPGWQGAPVLLAMQAHPSRNPSECR